MFSSLFWIFLPLKMGPPYAVAYLRREEISHANKVMQAIVGLHVVRFIADRFDAVQFGTSYANLRLPHIFERHI
jgi:hypothetical protein